MSDSGSVAAQDLISLGDIVGGSRVIAGILDGAYTVKISEVSYAGPELDLGESEIRFKIFIPKRSGTEWIDSILGTGRTLGKAAEAYLKEGFQSLSDAVWANVVVVRGSVFSSGEYSTADVEKYISETGRELAPESLACAMREEFRNIDIRQKMKLRWVNVMHPPAPDGKGGVMRLAILADKNNALGNPCARPNGTWQPDVGFACIEGYSSL